MRTRVDNCRWLLTLTLLNTIVLCVAGLPAALTDPIPHAFLTTLLYLITYIAQNFLFSVFLGLFLSPIFLYVESDRLKILFSIIPTAFLLFMFFMNAKVFAFWRIYIDSSVLQLYAYGGSQVFEMSKAMVIWIWVAGISFFILTVFIIIASKIIHRHFHLKTWFASLIFIYVIAQVSFIFLLTQENMSFLQYTMKVPYFYDLSWARSLEAMSAIRFSKNSLSPQLQRILTDDKKLNYPLHPLKYHLPKHALNVLLIVIDTLRYDMINPTNMPNVYHYAQYADQFLDNMSGGDCTKPGIFSLFYSIPATYWNAAIDHHQGSILIQAFQANHYQLGLYASAPLSSPQFNQTVFETVKNLQINTAGATSIDRDKTITTEMEQFLNHAAKNHHPFFGFLFYDAPHAYNALPLYTPFHPTESLNYFTIDNHTAAAPIYNLYKNAVLMDDQLVKKIVQTLKVNHLSHNTIVIITADHGQEFNDDHNNYWEHASGFSKYQMRTPMIIAWPHQSPTIFHAQTTHFDLAPTLLKRVLGVTNPASDYSIGDDLFSKKQPSFVIAGNYSYFALIMKNNIMQFQKSGLYRFTDLKMKPLNHEKENSVALEEAIHAMTKFQ